MKSSEADSERDGRAKTARTLDLGPSFIKKSYFGYCMRFGRVEGSLGRGPDDLRAERFQNIRLSARTEILEVFFQFSRRG